MESEHDYSSKGPATGLGRVDPVVRIGGVDLELPGVFDRPLRPPEDAQRTSFVSMSAYRCISSVEGLIATLAFAGVVKLVVAFPSVEVSVLFAAGGIRKDEDVGRSSASGDSALPTAAVAIVNLDAAKSFSRVDVP